MRKMTLTVPASPEWMLVLRLVTSGVGTIFDLPIDVVEDFKVAIEESGELLMHQPFCIQSLTMQCELSKQGLRVGLTAQKCDKVQEEEQMDADIAGMIIETLVKEVKIDKQEDGVHGVDLIFPVEYNEC